MTVVDFNLSTYYYTMTRLSKGRRLIHVGKAKGRKAFYRATAYFREILDEYRKTALADRLPTLAAMASAAGVAKGTMARAVQDVAAAERLEVKPGSGVRFGKDPAGTNRISNSPPPRITWEYIAAQLRKNILRGVFPAGQPLPKIYSLSERYGVCYRTINKAMRELHDQGLLIRRKKRYHTPLPVKQTEHNTILFVVAGDHMAPKLFETLRSHDLFREFENDCARSNVVFDLVQFDSTAERLYRGTKTISTVTLDDTRTTLGVMVWTMGMHTTSTITGLLVQLSSLKLPLSVLEESGNIPVMPPPLDKNKLLKVIYLACTERPGYDVGRYLIGLGHRKIAYIAPFHSETWSIPRLRGLRKAFAEAGYADAVDAFTSEEYVFPKQYSFTNRHLAGQAQDMLVQAVAPLYTPPELKHVLKSLGKYVDNAMTNYAFSRTVFPLFEQAKTCSDVTAWVTASDDVAFAALDYLQKSGISVPDQCSVIGFDNSLEASVQGLTSYDFNSQAALHELLNHLFYPHATRRGTKGATVEETEGFVLPRETSTVPPAPEPV